MGSVKVKRIGPDSRNIKTVENKGSKKQKISPTHMIAINYSILFKNYFSIKKKFKNYFSIENKGSKKQEISPTHAILLNKYLWHNFACITNSQILFSFFFNSLNQYLISHLPTKWVLEASHRFQDTNVISNFPVILDSPKKLLKNHQNLDLTLQWQKNLESATSACRSSVILGLLGEIIVDELNFSLGLQVRAQTKCFYSAQPIKS